MYTKTHISLEEARRVGDAAIAEALKNPDRTLTVCVVDADGEIVYYVRQDGHRWNPAAECTAYSAVRMGMDCKDIKPTLASWERTVDDFLDLRLTRFSGGVCLRASDGTIMGAIGISGRFPGVDKILDVDIARAGAKALNI